MYQGVPNASSGFFDYEPKSLFDLAYYFSIISALIILILASALAALFYHSDVRDMVRSTERLNSSLARALSNNLVVPFSDFFQNSQDMSPADIRSSSEFNQIDALVRMLAAGTQILKVKFYTLNGITVYSSDPSQIGESKLNNTGFLTASVDRIPASNLTEKESISAFSREMFGVHVVESYIPAYHINGSIGGVFEIYTDVSEQKQQVVDTTFRIVVGTLTISFFAYLALVILVRGASGVIKSQYLELSNSRDLLHNQNVTLDMQRTEFLDLTESLSSARDAAGAASRAKSSFLANMSHELRTPLNSVIGFSELLQSQAYGPIGDIRYLEYIDDIQVAGRHLLSIINDILDISKIEAGRMNLATEVIDTSEVLQVCCSMIRPQCEYRDINLVVDQPEECPELIGDPRALRQVVLNVLSNAVKFSPNDARILLAVSETEEGNTRISISDQGIGIAEENIEKVFKPFEQLPSLISSRHKGTGLGLSLSRQLVEMHNGTLSLESAIGVGTTVTIDLPKPSLAEMDRHRTGTINF